MQGILMPPSRLPPWVGRSAGLLASGFACLGLGGVTSHPLHQSPVTTLPWLPGAGVQPWAARQMRRSSQKEVGREAEMQGIRTRQRALASAAGTYQSDPREGSALSRAVLPGWLTELVWEAAGWKEGHRETQGPVTAPNDTSMHHLDLRLFRLYRKKVFEKLKRKIPSQLSG